MYAYKPILSIFLQIHVNMKITGWNEVKDERKVLSSYNSWNGVESKENYSE